MRKRLAVAALASLAVLASGCASDPPDPFAYEYGTGIGPLITRPGWEYGYLYDGGTNISHSTLTIDSVSLTGPGVGTVVALHDIRLADASRPNVGQGNYAEDPPVFGFNAHSCQKQALVPVKGYRVRPGGHFFLWLVVRALKPGRWRLPQQVFIYTENGGTYTHAFPIQYWGTVKTNAHVSALIGPGADQAACVKPEGAHYLRYYHG
jgi:hypothetical protein